MQSIAVQSPIFVKKKRNKIIIERYQQISIILYRIAKYLHFFYYLWVRWKSHDSKQWHSGGTPQITGNGEEVADGFGQTVHHVRVRGETFTVHQQDPGYNKEW